MAVQLVIAALLYRAVMVKNVLITSVPILSLAVAPVALQASIARLPVTKPVAHVILQIKVITTH